MTMQRTALPASFLAGAAVSETAYFRTARRFSRETTASDYCRNHHGSKRSRREQACILAGLRNVAAGSRVLDIPCGTGRLAPALVSRGFDVVGADISLPMLDKASRFWRDRCQAEPQLLTSRLRFEYRDIVASGYTDDEFDAVLCNRLLHHFMDAESRVAALAELGRICRGPVVVSYFDSFALGSLRIKLLRAFFGRFRKDRSLISLRRLTREAETVGLRLIDSIHTRWGISPQSYAVFERCS